MPSTAAIVTALNAPTGVGTGAFVALCGLVSIVISVAVIAYVVVDMIRNPVK